MGYEQTSYYLALYTPHNDSTFTISKNILFQEEPF
jgi:hypothetical protein